MFQCRNCGKQWNIEGYCEEGTFYTLCEECGKKAIEEWRTFLEDLDRKNGKKKEV